MEQGALISKEIGEVDKIAELSEKAAGLYRNHGVVDTAALTLDKGARMIDSQDTDKAIRLYRYAVDIVMVRFNLYYL